MTAATLDMSAKVDVVAKAGAFGADWGPWTWNVVNEPVALKSFGEGPRPPPPVPACPHTRPGSGHGRGHARSPAP